MIKEIILIFYFIETLFSSITLIIFKAKFKRQLRREGYKYNDIKILNKIIIICLMFIPIFNFLPADFILNKKISYDDFKEYGLKNGIIISNTKIGSVKLNQEIL